EMIRILENIDGEVVIRINKNQISFATPFLYLVSRIIDGIFPDYKQIVPKETKTEATLLKQDLVNSMKLSNVFSDKLNQVCMKISPKQKVFTLSTKNNDVGENTSNV